MIEYQIIISEQAAKDMSDIYELYTGIINRTSITI